MGIKEVTRKADIDDFLAQKKIAVVGVSRKKTKFGNAIFKELKKKDYRVFPVNPNMETFEGDPCYKDLKSLPEPVGGVVTCVHPGKTAEVVRDAAAAGISRVWMQQGSMSEEAVTFCKENNMTFVAGECILLYANPVESVHKFHRWIWKLIGKLAK
jgi:predicted CoA-binding protein